MRPRASHRKRPLETCAVRRAGCCDLIDDRTRICGAVVQFNTVSRHIEHIVSVVACICAGCWRVDVYNDCGASAAWLADLGAV